MAVEIQYNENDYLKLDNILEEAKKRKIELQKERSKKFLKDNNIKNIEQFNELFRDVFTEYEKLKGIDDEKNNYNNKYTKQRLDGQLQK